MNPIQVSGETRKKMAAMDHTLLFHRVMTQAHRWFQPYEQPECDFQNQLDILAPDIHILTTFGEVHGHQEYEQGFARLPAHWRNAHHVQAAEARLLGDDSFALTMEVVYQNIGLATAGQVQSHRLRYTTLFSSDAFLPQFKDIVTEPIGPETASIFGSFTDAYGQNRTKSLVHYWLALIEANTGDATPFQEIITEDLDFDFTTQRIRTFADFQQWFQTTSASVFKSSHLIKDFEVKQVETNRYRVTMEFDWSGFARSNPHQELEARTRHEWVVLDHPGERFARIQSIKVQAIKPFQHKVK